MSTLKHFKPGGTFTSILSRLSSLMKDTVTKEIELALVYTTGGFFCSEEAFSRLKTLMHQIP